MRLFFANTTNQVVHLHYRAPEHNRILSQHIPIGEQRQIGDDKWNEPQIADILEQNDKYAMIAYDKIDTFDRGCPIVGVFRMDKPTEAEVMRDVIAFNRRELTLEGIARRKELAVVTSKLLSQQNDMAGDTMALGIKLDKAGTVESGDSPKLDEAYVGPNSEEAQRAGRENTDNPGGGRGRRGGRN